MVFCWYDAISDVSMRIALVCLKLNLIFPETSLHTPSRGEERVRVEGTPTHTLLGYVFNHIVVKKIVFSWASNGFLKFVILGCGSLHYTIDEIYYLPSGVRLG